MYDTRAVTTVGEGQPFLWGHGLLSSRAAEDSSGPFRWSEIALPNVRLIRWDAPGHGEASTPEASGQCRWPALARDAIALADRECLDTFSIGGASMGAATALWVAATEPARVDRLVLAIPPTAWASRRRSARLYRIGGAVSDRLPVGGSRRKAAVLRGAAESDLPQPEVIQTLTAPTLVLAWRYDPVHPVRTAERLRDLLPAADLHVTSRPGDTSGWTERLQDFLTP